MDIRPGLYVLAKVTAITSVSVTLSIAIWLLLRI